MTFEKLDRVKIVVDPPWEGETLNEFNFIYNNILFKTSQEARYMLLLKMIEDKLTDILKHMTKRKNKKKQNGVNGNKKVNSEKILRRDVKKHITAVILLLVALVFVLSLFEQAGIIGEFVNKILTSLFGIGRYVLPILMISLGVMYFKRMQPVRYYLATGGMILFFLAGIGLVHSFNDIEVMAKVAKAGSGGGYIGFGIAFALIKLIGKVAGIASLFSLALIGFMLLFNAPVFNLFYKIKDWLKYDNEEEGGGLKEHSGKALTSNNYTNNNIVIPKESEKKVVETDDNRALQNSRPEGKKEEDVNKEPKVGFFKRIFKSRKERKAKKIEALGDNIKSVKFVEDSIADDKINNKKQGSVDIIKNQSVAINGSGSGQHIPKNSPAKIKNKLRKIKKNKIERKNKSKWQYPPINIFEKSEKNSGESNIEDNIEVIVRTLEDFGYTVEPSGFNIGPTVTQYTFAPPRGVMLNKIVGLQSNIALALAAPAIRIEAPIPGTSLIGIEVPNTKATMIRLGTLLSREDFKDSSSRLTIALGNDVNGNSIIVSLEKMPHLLVAGSTNTGKSVCINAILSALIFKNSPDDLQLILVDPKRVELSAYNGIPHLLTKVIVDMNKVVNTLKWATGEMDARYKLLEEVGAKNIESYNERVKNGDTKQVVDMESGEIRQEALQKMPYIVIVIDELADLMATHGKEVEALIVRLSQMSRAVGIHLILSTQRPDANVITGTIKNNIPARIAFKVAGNVDSRTILDRPGAEKLLGNGDMLYMGPGYPQPTRIQGPFVSEEETAKLIKYIKKQAKKIRFKKDEALKESLEGKMEEEVVSGDVREGESFGDDVLYSKAKEMVISAGQASISSLQRRLGIGYNRSAKIIDALEANGVIGPANGSKPREVLEQNDTTTIEEVPASENSPLADPLAEQETRDRREF